jgi:Glyoxalase/Bleomycin resistance protein/Dioxygenase superfamily
VLGPRLEAFGPGRIAFRFGDQKINLHEAGREFEPTAARPTPGALDLCFLAQGPLDAVVRRIEAAGIAIEAGPVPRTGATGPIRSVYVRDPDGNLIEIAEDARAPAAGGLDPRRRGAAPERLARDTASAARRVVWTAERAQHEKAANPHANWPIGRVSRGTAGALRLKVRGHGAQQGPSGPDGRVRSARRQVLRIRG